MRFSASSLPLLVDCAHSARPGVALEKDKPNDAMYVGNAVHKLAEWYLTGQPDDVVKACAFEKVKPGDVERVRRLWLELHAWIVDNAGAKALAEVAYCYAPEAGTARIIGHGIGRQYRDHGQLDCELAGTADMVIIADGTLFISDWKTGRSPAESYRWQLRLLGLAAARECGAGRVVIRVVRVGESEVDASWEEDLDAADLDDVAAEVLRVWREAPTAIAKPGGWCEEKYCKARNKCDAYRTWRAA